MCFCMCVLIKVAAFCFPLRCTSTLGSLLQPSTIFRRRSISSQALLTGTVYRGFADEAISQNVRLLGCVCKTVKICDDCCCSTRAHRYWLPCSHVYIHRVGQNHIFIRIYGVVCIRYFKQGNHHTYGHIRCVYTVLADPVYTAVYVHQHCTASAGYFVYLWVSWSCAPYCAFFHRQACSCVHFPQRTKLLCALHALVCTFHKNIMHVHARMNT